MKYVADIVESLCGLAVFLAIFTDFWKDVGSRIRFGKIGRLCDHDDK